MNAIFCRAKEVSDYVREIDHEARKHYCLKLHIVDEGFVLVQRCNESEQCTGGKSQ